MRTHPCVRLFCIIDTLTSASVLPGIDVIIEESSKGVAFTGHDHTDNMSSYGPGSIVPRASLSVAQIDDRGVALN
jgi:hypothetical protein